MVDTLFRWNKLKLNVDFLVSSKFIFQLSEKSEKVLQIIVIGQVINGRRKGSPNRQSGTVRSASVNKSQQFIFNFNEVVHWLDRFHVMFDYFVWSMSLRCYTDFICSYYLYIFRFGCKLNSLVLVDLFDQKVWRQLLQNTPQIYIANEFNTSDYRTGQHWFYECLCLGCIELSLELGSWRRMTSGVYATWRPGSNWTRAVVSNRAVFGLFTLQSK